MKLVALATSGARLCWAMMYIVPRERKRESRWEMEEKRRRDGESKWGGSRTERKEKLIAKTGRQRVKGTEEKGENKT